jgi:hypothetical protein
MTRGARWPKGTTRGSAPRTRTGEVVGAGEAVDAWVSDDADESHVLDAGDAGPIYFIGSERLATGRRAIRTSSDCTRRQPSIAGTVAAQLGTYWV